MSLALYKPPMPTSISGAQTAPCVRLLHASNSCSMTFSTQTGRKQPHKTLSFSRTSLPNSYKCVAQAPYAASSAWATPAASHPQLSLPLPACVTPSPAVCSRVSQTGRSRTPLPLAAQSQPTSTHRGRPDAWDDNPNSERRAAGEVRRTFRGRRTGALE